MKKLFQSLQSRLTKYKNMLRILCLMLQKNPIAGMKSILGLIKPFLLVVGTSITVEIFDGFSVSGLPNYRLLLWFGIAIVVDLLTGIGKAVALKQNRTSEGYRKTVIKFAQYGGTLIIAIIISSVATQQSLDIAPYATFLDNTLVVWFIYIELTSVCENLIAINPTSLIVNFVIRPLHRLLTIQLTKQTEVPDLVEKDKGQKSDA